MTGHRRIAHPFGLVAKASREDDDSPNIPPQFVLVSLSLILCARPVTTRDVATITGFKLTSCRVALWTLAGRGEVRKFRQAAGARESYWLARLFRDVWRDAPELRCMDEAEIEAVRASLRGLMERSPKVRARHVVLPEWMR